MPWIAAGAVVSAGIGAYASSSAADKASGSADQAARLNQQQNDQTRQDLFPYNVLGQNGAAAIQAGQFQFGQADMTDVNAARNYFQQAATLGSGPGAQAALEQTPGYQFARNQGLQAVQNSAAARGLGVSGAALKGAASYATGLADQTYTNQFNKLVQSGQNSLATNTAQQGNILNTYNRLSDTTKIGLDAAAKTGSIGATLTNQAGNALIASGNAQAAGDLGIGNSITDSINAGFKNYFKQKGMTDGSNTPDPNAAF